MTLFFVTPSGGRLALVCGQEPWPPDCPPERLIVDRLSLL